MGHAGTEAGTPLLSAPLCEGQGSAGKPCGPHALRNSRVSHGLWSREPCPAPWHIHSWLRPPGRPAFLICASEGSSEGTWSLSRSGRDRSLPECLPPFCWAPGSGWPRSCLVVGTCTGAHGAGRPPPPPCHTRESSGASRLLFRVPSLRKRSSVPPSPVPGGPPAGEGCRALAVIAAPWTVAASETSGISRESEPPTVPASLPGAAPALGCHVGREHRETGGAGAVWWQDSALTAPTSGQCGVASSAGLGARPRGQPRGQGDSVTHSTCVLFPADLASSSPLTPKHTCFIPSPVVSRPARWPPPQSHVGR